MMHSRGEDAEIGDPVLLIRINQLYRPGMPAHDLYEATRGVWKLGERRYGAKYALAVFGGVVQEAYAIDSWHPAGSTLYTTRTDEDVRRPGRWEFLGELAPEEVRSRYVGRSVLAYFRPGAQNPIAYANC